MAPEQHDGKTGDAQSDQFSFAVSLFESLHGRRPFAGRSAGEIAAATRSGQLAAGGDGVPRAIDVALARALAPDPASRYPSLDSVRALQRARAKRPAVAWLAGAAVATVGAAGARLWTHHGTTASNPPPIETTIPFMAASTTASKPAPPAPPPTAAVDWSGRGAPAVVAPRAASDGPSRRPVTSGRARKRQARGAPAVQFEPPQPAAPAIVTQAQILARAEREMHRRDGAAVSPRSARSSASGPKRLRRARRRTAATASCSSAIAPKERSCSNRRT